MSELQKSYSPAQFPKHKYHPAGGSIVVNDVHQEKQHAEFALNEPPPEAAKPAKAAKDAKVAEAKTDAT